MLLGFADYRHQAAALAEALALPCREVALHRFPDGESKVTLPSTLPERVLICRSLDRPNDKLIELLLTARTARLCGARQLILIAPYLCYMRQDKAFHPGEAVSQTLVGAFLADQDEMVQRRNPLSSARGPRYTGCRLKQCRNP